MKRCQYCELLISDTQYNSFKKHQAKCSKAEPWQRIYYRRDRKWPRKHQKAPEWTKI